ncbi:MAG: trigger factor [Bacteroidales bacterium]|jgi:trigger factor|nr:trigger factor [Bacteroidales bacterium]
MEVTQNNIDALNATIKVTLTKDDYQSKVDNSLKDIQRKANFKGFRPGKAPMGLVKKEFNTRVMAEEINKVLSKGLFDYLHDNKIDYMGDPLPSEREKTEVDFSKDTDYTFYFDIALAPEFDVQIDNNLKLTQYVIDVEPSVVDKAVEQYKNAAGKQEPAEVSTEKSFLKGEVFQVDEKGEKLEGGLSNTTSMLVDRVKDEKQRAGFIGKKVGDQISFDLTQVFPNESEAKALLGNNMIDFKTMNVNFAFKIEEISNFVQGELTQEVYDRFFGEDKVHNEDELRATIVEQYKEGYAMESDIKLMIDTRKTLVENGKFDVPMDFMVRWMLNLEQYKDFDREKLEKQFPNMKDDIKWNLIEGKIVKNNNIEISDDEMLEAAKDLTAQEFARYGIRPSQIPADMLDNYAKERLAKAQDKNMIRSQVVSKKITELVKEKATLTQQNISYADFSKLFED